MAQAPSLKIEGVSAGYGGKSVLHDVSFNVTEPSIYVGPGRSQGTTLLRTIAGILKPEIGHVNFDGADVYSSKETRQRLSYLSHLNALPEEMTVRRALEFC